MSLDWQTIAGVIGGGAVVKLIELWRVRFDDAARMRRELWKEVGALREICKQQDDKLDALAEQVRGLRDELRLSESRIVTYRAACLDLMRAVNDRDDELGHPMTYDLHAEKLRMEQSDRSEGEVPPRLRVQT